MWRSSGPQCRAPKRPGSASTTFGLDRGSDAAARSSLGAAQKVAAELAANADGFVRLSNQAFVDAMSIGLRISVVVALGAVLAWRYLRPMRRIQKPPIG